MKLARATKKAAAMILVFAMAFGLFAGLAAETVHASLPTVHAVNAGTGVITVTVTAPAGSLLSWASATAMGIDATNPHSVASSMPTSNLNTQSVVLTISGLLNGNHRVDVSVQYWDGFTGTTWTTINVGAGAGGTGGLGTPTIISESGGWLHLRAVIPPGTSFSQLHDDIGFSVSPWDNVPDASNFHWNALITTDAAGNQVMEGHVILPHLGAQQFIFAAIRPNRVGAIISSAVPLAVSPGMATVGWVNAPTFSTSTGLMTANGNLSRVGDFNITELGFVYSNTHQTPALLAGGSPASGSFKQVAVSTVTSTAREFSSSFAPQFAANATGNTFWIRPYAINSQGNIVYGATQTVMGVDLSLIGGGQVQLGTFNVSGVNASATVTVSGVAAGNIDEWGIVYSSVNRTPSRTGDTRNVFYVHGPFGATTAEIHLENLTANTTYWARAFVRARGGGQYVYSSVREVRTETDVNITMFAPSEMTHNSVLLSGSLTTTANIIDMGFVYSRINNEPTVDDIRVSLTQPRTGNFNLEVTRLAPDTRYFVRAFVRYGNRPQDVAYSQVFEFSTTREAGAVITISFRDQAGQEFGTQTINAAIGNPMTEAILNVPQGMRLVNERWSFTPFGNEHVVVQVMPGGAAQPGPGPGPGPGHPPGVLQGYDPHNEQAYMVGRPGGRFAPEEPGTVLEVATMLYTLMADPFQMYQYPQWFGDIDYSDMNMVNIINFVASRGYMAADPAGNFNPHSPITRAELAAVMANALDLLNRYEELGMWGWPSNYPDTDHHWARGFVFATSHHGIFGGLPDGLFHPDVPVNRAQLAHAFASMFNRTGHPLGHAFFLDVTPDHWAFNAIMNAALPMQ